MNVTPAAAPVEPQPLPGRKQPRPSPDHDTFGWLGREVVRVTFTNASAKGAVEQFSNRFGIDGLWRPDQAYSERIDPLIKSLTTARSLAAAVSIASEASAVAGLSLGLFKARSGAYYLASLVEREGFEVTSLRIDPRRVVPLFGPPALVQAEEASALMPELKAIVGERTWFNFTDQEIDPELAG